MEIKGCTINIIMTTKLFIIYNKFGILPQKGTTLHNLVRIKYFISFSLILIFCISLKNKRF